MVAVLHHQALEPPLLDVAARFVATMEAVRVRETNKLCMMRLSTIKVRSII